MRFEDLIDVPVCICRGLKRQCADVFYQDLHIRERIAGGCVGRGLTLEITGHEMIVGFIVGVDQLLLGLMRYPVIRVVRRSLDQRRSTRRVIFGIVRDPTQDVIGPGRPQNIIVAAGRILDAGILKIAVGGIGIMLRRMIGISAETRWLAASYPINVPVSP